MNRDLSKSNDLIKNTDVEIPQQTKDTKFMGIYR